MEIPDRLRQLRLERQYSQYDVADATGLNRSTYNNLERGTPAQFEWIIKLCRHYGVSADYILGLSDNPRGYYRVALQPDVIDLVDVVREASASKRAEILEVARVMVAHEREELIAAMTGLSQQDGTPGDAPIWVEIMEQLLAAQASLPQQDDPPEDMTDWAEAMIEALPEAMRTALLDTLVRVENVATITDARRAFEMVTEEEEREAGAIVSQQDAD